MALGKTMNKFIWIYPSVYNLERLSPCGVVSEIIRRLSPNIEPQSKAQAIQGQWYRWS
jgi:hypothetical protein